MHRNKIYIILTVYFDRFNFDDGVVLVFVHRIEIKIILKTG